ncbi:hypothetical protein K0U07_05535 [bacterium]|nr:hypothetical protein [bacterium]
MYAQMMQNGIKKDFSVSASLVGFATVVSAIFAGRKIVQIQAREDLNRQQKNVLADRRIHEIAGSFFTFALTALAGFIVEYSSEWRQMRTIVTDSTLGAVQRTSFLLFLAAVARVLVISGRMENEEILLRKPETRDQDAQTGENPAGRRITPTRPQER